MSEETTESVPDESVADTEPGTEDDARADIDPAAESPADAPATPALPRRLVFRVPGSAYVVIAFLMLCVSFVAVASPFATLVYLLPVGAIVWVARTRTEVDAERLVARTVLYRTVVPWSKVESLRVAERGWIRVVRTDGGEVALPTVRTRHLPALALISGGRLSDPTADQS
ncbi:MAG TPA: PH domain-containing protein [Pseudonocardiaceae bacterium]|nr:PH domain-containing protein [Pseudonocardiaceae bacterium]